MDIVTGENFPSINLANMDLIYRPVRSFSSWGDDWVKRLESELVILATCEHHLIRAHENLVQHPRNNISIAATMQDKDKCRYK